MPYYDYYYGIMIITNNKTKMLNFALLNNNANQCQFKYKGRHALCNILLRILR